MLVAAKVVPKTLMTNLENNLILPGYCPEMRGRDSVELNSRASPRCVQAMQREGGLGQVAAEHADLGMGEVEHQDSTESLLGDSLRGRVELRGDFLRQS